MNCLRHFKIICSWLGERNQLNSREEKALTKSDLIEKLAQLERINLKAAEFAVNAVFESMAKTMVKEAVSRSGVLVRFGLRITKDLRATTPKPGNQSA